MQSLYERNPVDMANTSKDRSSNPQLEVKDLFHLHHMHLGYDHIKLRHCEMGRISFALCTRGGSLTEVTKDRALSVHAFISAELGIHLVAVHVKAIGAIDALEDYGLTTNRLECAHWRVHATGQQRLRLSKYLHKPGVHAFLKHQFDNFLI